LCERPAEVLVRGIAGVDSVGVGDAPVAIMFTAADGAVTVNRLVAFRAGPRL
jgi:hypothetical protein